MLPSLLRSSTAHLHLSSQSPSHHHASPSSQAASPATERSFEVLSAGREEQGEDKFEVISAADKSQAVGVSNTEQPDLSSPNSPTHHFIGSEAGDDEPKRDRLARWYQNLEDLTPSFPPLPPLPTFSSPVSSKEVLILLAGMGLGLGVAYGAMLKKDQEHSRENQNLALAVRGLTSALDRAHREKTEAILQASSSASRLDSTRARLADALRQSQQSGKAAIMSAGGAALVAIVALFL